MKIGNILFTSAFAAALARVMVNQGFADEPEYISRAIKELKECVEALPPETPEGLEDRIVTDTLLPFPAGRRLVALETPGGDYNVPHAILASYIRWNAGFAESTDPRITFYVNKIVEEIVAEFNEKFARYFWGYYPRSDTTLFDDIRHGKYVRKVGHSGVIRREILICVAAYLKSNILVFPISDENEGGIFWGSPLRDDRTCVICQRKREHHQEARRFLAVRYLKDQDIDTLENLVINQVSFKPISEYLSLSGTKTTEFSVDGYQYLSDTKRRVPRVTPVDELSLSRIFVA